MAKFISLGIDLNKIDKSKIVEGKNGAKYINAVVWLNDKEDQYVNTAAIQQSGSKEDREAGYKGAYLGNGKHFGLGIDTQSSSDGGVDDLF